MPGLFAGLQRIDFDPASLRAVYPTFEDISVDYGIMEKAAGVAVVRGDFERIDVGNLSTLGDLLEGNPQGNAVAGLLVEKDSRDNVIYSDEGLVGLIGVQDMIVVRKGDVVLVCPKERARRLKTWWRCWQRRTWTNSDELPVDHLIRLGRHADRFAAE